MVVDHSSLSLRVLIMHRISGKVIKVALLLSVPLFLKLR
jgi:hypothetical protein